MYYIISTIIYWLCTVFLLSHLFYFLFSFFSFFDSFFSHEIFGSGFFRHLQVWNLHQVCLDWMHQYFLQNSLRMDYIEFYLLKLSLNYRCLKKPEPEISWMTQARGIVKSKSNIFVIENNLGSIISSISKSWKWFSRLIC